MANQKEKGGKEKKKNGLLKYFKEVFAELKRVNWPDRQKLLQSTAAVFFLSICFALLIWVVDTLVYGGLNLIGFHERNELARPTTAVTETVPATETSAVATEVSTVASEATTATSPSSETAGK